MFDQTSNNLTVCLISHQTIYLKWHKKTNPIENGSLSYFVMITIHKYSEPSDSLAYSVLILYTQESLAKANTTTLCQTNVYAD